MAAYVPVALSEDARGFLRTVAPAGTTFRDLLAAIDALHDATVRRPGVRLLIELSAVVPVPTMVEQTIVGEHLARQLVHAEKIASLVAEGTRTGYTERVARRLGLQLMVFTSEQEAVAWLIA